MKSLFISRLRAGMSPVLFLLIEAVLSTLAVGQPAVQGQWATLPFQMPINPVHMALMNNGKVLIVSGSGNVPTNTNFAAAVWDPKSGAITTQPLGWDMFCSGMAILPDGRPFVVGGTTQYDPFLGALTTSAYDPVTGIFADQQSMAHGRWYPSIISLGDGSLMTFSGSDETGATNTAVEIYKPGTGWSQEFIAPWTPPFYPRLHLLPNGKVFYSGSTTSSNIFDPATQTWTMNVAQTNYGSTRGYGTSVLLPLTPANGYRPKVMIMGGGNPATATTEIIDLGAAKPRWVFGPSMSQPRVQMNATILPNGRVVALGGSANDEDGSTASFNADIYDPSSNTFTTGAPNAFPRLYHSNSLLLPDATLMVTGSNPARGIYEQNSEIYSPPYLFNADGSAATRPVITGVSPSTVAYGAGFQVQTADAASIHSVVLMRLGAVTHSFDMEQRLVGLSFTAGNGVLSVTAPSNGNIAPEGYYMLFILNSSGVPSVASFIQIPPSTSNPAPGFRLVQRSAPGYVAAGSQSVTLNGVGAGHLLIVCAYDNVDTGVTMSISDTLGSTWSSTSPITNTLSSGGPLSMRIFYAVAPATGNDTITLTQSSGTAPLGGLYFEYAGNGSSNVLDATAGQAAPSSTSSASSPNITTTGAHDLLLGFFGDTAGAGTITAGSGFTMQLTDVNFYSGAEDQQNIVAGTYKATAAMPNTDASWIAIIASFK